MRIGIVGAGGVGSVVGGLLSHGGHDVTLVDQWPEHIDKIKRDGLLIESRDQSILTRPMPYTSVSSHKSQIPLKPHLLL